MTRRALRFTFLAAMVAGAIVLGLRLAGWRSFGVFGRSSPPSMANLAAAMGPDRLHVGQLAGRWPHRPLHASRGEREGRLSKNLELVSLAARLQQDMRRSPDAHTVHAYGVALLLLGEDSAAADTLEQSILQDSTDAAYHADLSAAYLSRAVSGNRPSDFVRALESAEHALSLDGSSLAGLFNRALALEELGLQRQAFDNWRAYIAKSGDDEWAREAQARLSRQSSARPMDAWKAVRAAILSSNTMPDRTALAPFTQQARALVEDDLLPRWAEDWEAGRLGASIAELAGARRLAEFLSSDNGDQLTLESVRAVEEALEQKDAPRTGTLAKGHREFRRLRDAYLSMHYDEASAAANRAAALLHAGRSPFEYWARMYLVMTSYYTGAMETSSRICDDILAETAGKPYHALRGRGFWNRGVHLYAQTQYEVALRDYRHGIEEFDRARETANGAAVRQQTAEALRKLGQTEDSWRQYREALQRLPLIDDPVRVHALLTSLGLANLRQGNNATARYFFDAAIDNGLVGNGTPLIEARFNRARALVRLGHFDEGVKDLELARAALEGVSASGLRKRVYAEWLSADAEIQVDRNPGRAVDSASVALTGYDELNTLFRTASLLQVRGRAYARLGQAREAQADYRHGIEVIEDERARVKQQSLRVSYFDSVWDLYGGLMEQLIDDNDFNGAFEVSERSRSRTLLDARGTVPLPLSALSARLDASATLLSFSVLDREIVVWSAHGGATRVHRIPYDRSRLRALVSAFRASIEEHQPDGLALRLSHELYDLLLKPFGNELAHTTRLHLSASDSLHWVPWAALQNPAGGHFLIEDMEIELLSQASGLTDGRSRIQAGKVVIMRPRTDEGDGSRLPGASREAHDIGSIWPDAIRVDGGAATKEAVLEALQSASIIHFAGHAQSDPEFGWESRLIVDASSDGSAGAVTGAEILRLKSRADLVILAACSTGYGPLSRGEGALSLGWALTVAGVQHVVATLWDIDDAASAQLFVEFHKTLAATGDPAAALRASQRRLAVADRDLRNGYLWAGVVYLGG